MSISRTIVIALGISIWLAVAVTALSHVVGGHPEDVLLVIPVTVLALQLFRIRATRRLGRLQTTSVGASTPETRPGQTVLG